MFHSSRYLPSTLAIPFAPLPPWSDHPIGTNASNHSTGVFGRYLALHPASSVGWMDCPGRYNSHSGKWYCHVRNEEDLGEQKGSKEEDS